MHDGLTPDLSLGTHFFHELVERDMLYIGFFGSRETSCLDEQALHDWPNLLGDLLPDASSLDQTIRVIDAPPGKKLTLSADSLRQEAVVYLVPETLEAGSC